MIALADAPARAAVAAAPRGGTDWAQVALNAYIAVFMLYLFLPLVLMALAAFNANDTPSVTDWRGFTLDWFTGRTNEAGEVLVRGLPQETRFLEGLARSVGIALGVIALAIPLGLAGALVLSRLGAASGSFLYTLLVSPILTPGIVLGVSTMTLWRDAFGVEAGPLTVVIAHSSFIASYCMLMFMARLQRLDPALEEAALDLGASNLFAFRRVTLPFLGPTIATAAVVAFLQSFENYNTTFFAIGSSFTLVTEIGSRMRFGLSPTINAIGMLFILLTVAAATVWVLLRRRQA